MAMTSYPACNKTSLSQSFVGLESRTWTRVRLESHLLGIDLRPVDLNGDVFT